MKYVLDIEAFETYPEEIRTIMEKQKEYTCFDCPEFDSLKGCCKRGNKSEPCIKYKP